MLVATAAVATAVSVSRSVGVGGRGQYWRMEYYPYPPVDRIDPFDVRRGAPQFIVFGGDRSSYATTERPDLLGLELADWIPMGYKIVQYAQKAAVFRRGRLAREWKPVVEGPGEEPERVDPDAPFAELRQRMQPQIHRWLRQVCGYRVTVPSGERITLGYDRDEAWEAGKAASGKHGLAAVWFVYNAANWH